MAAKNPNIAALVEQMPETDKDLQAKADELKQQTQPDASDKPKPKADRFGTASKFTGPDPATAETIFTTILSGGRDSIVELLELLREPSEADYKNYKPTYVLHGLVLYAGRVGQESQRRLLARTIASRLDSDKPSKAAKAVLIRELRVLGGKESVDVLGKQLLDDELCGEAALALLTIHEGVASEFRNAFNRVKGRNYVTILQALGVLQDKASSAALKKALTDENRDVRRTAAWSLANIGDASSAEALLKAADAAEGWERAQATKACLLLAEKLTAANQTPQAARIYSHLRGTRTDPKERHVREAAEMALGAMAQ